MGFLKKVFGRRGKEAVPGASDDTEPKQDLGQTGIVNPSTLAERQRSEVHDDADDRSFEIAASLRELAPELKQLYEEVGLQEVVEILDQKEVSDESFSDLVTYLALNSTQIWQEINAMFTTNSSSSIPTTLLRRLSQEDKNWMPPSLELSKEQRSQGLATIRPRLVDYSYDSEQKSPSFRVRMQVIVQYPLTNEQKKRWNAIKFKVSFDLFLTPTKSGDSLRRTYPLLAKVNFASQEEFNGFTFVTRDLDGDQYGLVRPLDVLKESGNSVVNEITGETAWMPKEDLAKIVGENLESDQRKTDEESNETFKGNFALAEGEDILNLKQLDREGKLEPRAFMKKHLERKKPNLKIISEEKPE